MASSKKQRLLPQARALYAEGLSTGEIAAALDVAPSTIRRWAKADRAQGSPWQRDEAPAAATPSPHVAQAPSLAAFGSAPAGASRERLVEMLQGRLERLVEARAGDIDDSGLEDHLLKICKVLDFVREGADDLTARLEAVKEFAAFCSRSLSEAEMGPVRKAIELFLEELKGERE